MERQFKIYTVNNLPDPTNPGFDIDGIYSVANGSKLSIFIRKEDNSDWVSVKENDLSEYLTETQSDSKYIRFDDFQDLSEQQKTQSRDNSGSAAKTDVNWGTKDW